MSSSPTDPAAAPAVATVPGPADAATVLARVLDGGTGTAGDAPVVLEAGYGWGAFATDVPEPLVVLTRVGPRAADATAREAAWLTWLDAAGFPAVPLVGSVSDAPTPGGAVGLVVRRVDRSFVERIAESPTEAPDVLGDMGAMQARLHSLATDGAPAAAAPGGGALVDAVRARATAAGKDDLVAALDTIAPIIAASSAPLVVGHGDMSPGNVRLDADGAPALAAWGRATLAPAGWDLARGTLTIWASAYLAPNRAHRAAMKMLRDYLVERYQSGYAKGVEDAGIPPVPAEDLTAWDVVHACDWSLDLDAGPRPGDPWDPLLLVNDTKGLARDLARRIRRTTEEIR
jgi:hypothetical protein